MFGLINTVKDDDEESELAEHREHDEGSISASISCLQPQYARILIGSSEPKLWHFSPGGNSLAAFTQSAHEKANNGGTSLSEEKAGPSWPVGQKEHEEGSASGQPQ